MSEERERTEQARKTLEYIERLKNAAYQQEYDLKRPQEFNLKIEPNESIAPAMFRPHPDKPGIYEATSLTIRAMKKDIFLAGNDVDELKQPHTCTSCQQPLDRQFWFMCPYCGESFKD